MSSAPIIFKTDRLYLLAGSFALAQAEIEDPALFSRLLEARIPDNWPPPLNNRDTMLFNLKHLEIDGSQEGWWSWYFILNELDSPERILIGNGGFKGPPDASETVELGYSICREYQNRGFATEAVFGLIYWAFQQDGVSRVTAETLPSMKASIRVLEKNNFDYQGEGSEPGVIRYALTRNRFESIMEI